MTATDGAQRDGTQRDGGMRDGAHRGGTLFRRVFVATAAVVAMVLAMVLVALSLSARRAADAALARGLEATGRHAAALLDGRERALGSAALVFVQDPGFRALVLDRRPADLLDQALEAQQRTGASWVQLTDADGVRVARSDEPTAPPVQLAGTALVAGALAGDVMTGTGVAGDSALFQGVAVPITVGTQVAGVLMAAATVDGALADSLAALTGSEVLFYLRDEAGAVRVTAASLPRTAAVQRLAEAHARAADGASAPVEGTIDGARYVGRGRPLRSAGGELLGGVVTLRSREAELAPFAALRRRIVLAGALGLALAFALSWLVARQIARPILALTAATRRAQAGDWAGAALAGAPDGEPAGELGALAAAVRSVLADVRERHVVADFLARRPPPPPAPIEPPPASFAPGRLVARRWEIERVLGVGGGGVVYRALDRELAETVALKTLRPEALAGGPAALERFKDEIRFARRISHPNVVRIHDIGEDAGTWFITMEHVAGTSLAELLARVGRLPPEVTRALGAQLCQALEVAHAQGIIHRDVKPQNIMLQPDGVLKVMDFGIARLAERSSGMTVTGMAVGTPAYMAPEQLLGEHVDARVDVYAAGVVLYECLTGRRPLSPVAGRTPTGVEPPHVVEPSVPATLSAAVLRALAADPDERPPSAAALHALLVEGDAGATEGRGAVRPPFGGRFRRPEPDAARPPG